MQYVKLELSGRYREIGSQVMSLGRPKEKDFRLDLFYGQIARILERPSLSHVLVDRHKDFFVPAFGGLEEIRSGLLRLTSAGREVWYYAPEYNMSDCVLASACSRRILHPLGQVAFAGLAMSSLFFKKLLDEHEIDVTIIRRDRYKSAADNLRTTGYDKFAREQYQGLLDGTVATLRESVINSSRDRNGFPEKILDDMIGGTIYTAGEAIEAGLVDELRTVGDITNEWSKKKARRKRAGRRLFRWGYQPRVAVLVFEGMIIEGGNRRHPLFGQATGDRPIISYIRALKKNPKVKGVIFRINSGGGSATASENILHELAELHKKKPLVISMGPVAGSGGYWISGTGRRLFALPTTITGSIGVLSVYFNIARLLEKYGINADSVKHGDSADIGSALRQLTEKEHKMIDGIVEFLYGEFIKRVADSRQLSPERVQELAEGRVWLGRKAAGNGLVDEVGGLHDAVNHIKKILDAKHIKLSFLPRQPWIVRWISRRTQGPGAGVFSSLAAFAGLQTEVTEIPMPLELAKACLSVHGQPLLMDLLLAQYVSGQTWHG
jgi:protease IV